MIERITEALQTLNEYREQCRRDGGTDGPEARGYLDMCEQLLQDLCVPVPMLLWCPQCNARHVDEGEFATKPHRTHSCQCCGMVWRPALVHTVGVEFLPGYRNVPAEQS